MEFWEHKGRGAKPAQRATLGEPGQLLGVTMRVKTREASLIHQQVGEPLELGAL
jgi:hypothetical protein